MAKCPNCGLETARTEDWACQWCGYPLLSGAYKRIPKTYQQLVEEKLRKLKPHISEDTEALLEPDHVILPASSALEPEEKVARDAEAVLEEETEAVLEEEAEAVLEEEAEAVLEEEAEAVLEEEDDAEAVPEPVPKPVTPVIELTVEELVLAYTSNVVAAHERFENKNLKVRGTLGRVGINDINSNYYLNLVATGGEAFWDVKCTFDRKHVPELNRLTTGQTVTVQGEYVGYVTEILMRDCTLGAF
ncbi:hypothetical protein ACFLTZ_05915 [Chloroflexota bacterium]